jgi:hypothetical protein
MSLIALVALDLGATDKREAFYEFLESNNWARFTPPISDSYRVSFGSEWTVAKAKERIQTRLREACEKTGVIHYSAAVSISADGVQLITE